MSSLKFGASLRDVLWQAQDGRCWLCEGNMGRKTSNDPRSCSIDHVWPKARYGQLGDIGVTLLACRRCNAQRGSPMPSDEDVRSLVRVWRKVDRRWLRWNLMMIQADLERLKVATGRVEILKILEAA